MDHEHILALVEAVHWAHGEAIHGFAANAAFVDDESQFSTPNTLERATLAKKVVPYTQQREPVLLLQRVKLISARGPPASLGPKPSSIWAANNLNLLPEAHSQRRALRVFWASPAGIGAKSQFAAETTKSWLVLFARAVRPRERSARRLARRQPVYVYVGDLGHSSRQPPVALAHVWRERQLVRQLWPLAFDHGSRFIRDMLDALDIRACIL
jgi:hypothetical protein